MSDSRARRPNNGVIDVVRQLLGDAVRDVLESVGGQRRAYELVARLVLEQDAPAAHVQFLLRAADDPSLIIEPSPRDAWRRPVRFVTGNGHEVVSVARRIRRAGRVFAPFARAANTGNPLRVALSPDELVTLLTVGAQAVGPGRDRATPDRAHGGRTRPSARSPARRRRRRRCRPVPELGHG